MATAADIEKVLASELSPATAEDDEITEMLKKAAAMPLTDQQKYEHMVSWVMGMLPRSMRGKISRAQVEAYLKQHS